MENNSNVKSSCLMLAASLNTPVSLGAIFEANDLKDTGIEYDSHITVLYAREFVILILFSLNCPIGGLMYFISY